VFCYDGDNAGQNATMKAGRLARSEGCDVSVVDNRTGLDPDELLKQNGPDGLKQMVRTELMWIEFVLKYLKDRTNLDNYQERKKFASQVKEEIDTLDDEMDRRYFTEELSKLTGFQLDYEPRQAQKPMTKPAGAAKVEDGLVSAEEQILATMLGHKEAAQHFSDKLGFLQDKVRDAVAILMIDAYRVEDVLDPAALIDKAETQEERNLITRLIGHWAAVTPYDESAMDGAIRKVNISLKRAQADRYREQLASDMNKESTKVLLEEYRECLNDLRRYIDEEN
jgi:DNA primase